MRRRRLILLTGLGFLYLSDQPCFDRFGDLARVRAGQGVLAQKAFPQGIATFYQGWGKAMQVSAPGTADGNAPFALMYQEPLPDSGGFLYSGFIRKPKVTLLIMRSDWEGTRLPAHFASREDVLEGEFNVYPKDVAIQALRKRLNAQYADYAKQGPSRKEIIDDCRREDREKSSRTVHLFVGIDDPFVKRNGISRSRPIQDQFTGHMAVVLSRSPRDLLNEEDHFGALPRKEGEVWAGLNRLGLAETGDFSPLTTGDIEQDRVRRLLRFTLWQKTLSYLAWDVRANGAVAQVNSEVRDKLRKQGILTFDSRPVKTKWGDEWVITLSREQLLKSEENVQRERLIFFLERYMERQGGLPPPTFYLEPNERDAWVRLGIVRTVSGMPVPSKGSIQIGLDPQLPAKIVQSAFFLRPSQNSGDDFVPLTAPAAEYLTTPVVGAQFDKDTARRLLNKLRAESTATK